jgi:hypothetical protein
MSAPLGNQFWKLRSKHGRDKLFETPELMWEAACEYFQWCHDNPWYKREQVKMPGKGYTDSEGEYHPPELITEIPTERPLTLTGLCLYLDCNSAYFRQFKTTCSNDFSTIISRIEDTIYTQKFEGAAVGTFNANIIARDLGLHDKVDTDITSGGVPFNITLNL